MEHIVFNLDDKKKLKKAQELSNKKTHSAQLLQIFTYITDKNELQDLLKKINKKFSNCIIIGTTTAGEIANAKMYDNATIISLSLFNDTKLKVKYMSKIDKQSGEILSQKLCSKNTKAAVILSEGLKGEDYEKFIHSFNEKNPNVLIAGGLAGDNFNLKNTFVFLGNTVYAEGSVAVSFSGKTLFADSKYNLNWEPIGKSFQVTSCTKNVVHEIDGISAVEVFRKYLGENIFKNNAQTLPNFQLLYKEGETTVSRTPLAVDGDSLVFAGPIKVGQTVQFGFANSSAVISGSKGIKNIIQKNPAEAIYIFSCIARKTLLGKSLEKEFEQFNEIAPTAGFFTYGEYFSTNNNNALLNCTTTILVLSESKQTAKSKKQNKTPQTKNINNATFSALTHFIKQTASELNANVNLLNQYKEAVDLSLIVSKTDEKGLITYVNENFIKLSGYTKEELIGNSHNIVRDPSTTQHTFKKLWNTIKSGNVWKGQLTNRAKDGTQYYVSVTITSTYDENGIFDGYIAVRKDITKQIISKKRIAEKEKLIKAIFDSQDSIVVYSSKTDGMLNVNQALFNNLDFKNFEDFKSKHHCICELFIKEDGFVHPDDDPTWADTLSQNQNKDYKVKIKTKDNIVRTFKIKVKKMDDTYITNLSDITNLEIALQKAYSSEQAKSIFLANMSHEIRTPLNGILGFTDVLRKKELDTDSKKYIDIIHKSGQSLLYVVNDILDFSKIESGELSIYKTESNLFLEMEAAVATFASTSREKHIDYYTYIDTNIPKILLCDSQRIKQVLNNLISNAIKFTPDGGAVRVNISLKEIKNQEAIIHFSVKDSGIGIPQNKISTIFEAFSQADDSISRKFGGTGLGLSISNKFTQMMGDALKVKSEEGKGSEFYCELKLPIINASNNMEKSFDINNINIKIIQPDTKVACGVNEVISTYLNTWACNYTTIDNLDEIDEATDILIVCAKLFDEESCKNALEQFNKLQLIYIEGGDNSFRCAHEKFHIIEQPMTGSSLFDMIITIAHNKNYTVKTTHDIDESNKYNGNVLIAEDNETNQLLISVLLNERGVNYKIVNNGQEAVDEALKNEYDLLFMDINMPILDGVSATKILREKEYTKTIVSLSANVIESDIQTFKKAGVNDTLNKPIIPNELDTILDKYLKQKNKKMSLKYDEINLETLSTALSLPNQDIIKKLLQSFSESAQEMIKVLKDKKLDKDILHAIKGLSGNLRFNELFTTVKKFEDEFENWNDAENTQNREIILSHLQKAVENISDLLN